MIIAGLLATLILGAMLFFSGVVAPLVFMTLPATEAGKFLRAIFPRYYLVNGAIASAAALFAGLTVEGAAFAGIAFLLLASRFIAIPIINRARDLMLEGDGAAKRRFDNWHRGTVAANLVEIVILCAVIWKIFLS